MPDKRPGRVEVTAILTLACCVYALRVSSALKMGDNSVLTNRSSDVDFFLDELCKMLISSADPEFRRVHIRTLPAANHKTLAAFLLTGPAVPDSSNVKSKLALEMLQKPGGARSVAFLSAMTSRLAGGSTMKEVALAEAGPGRWISLVTSAKTPAAIADQKSAFLDFAEIMGPLWGHSMEYIAVPIADLNPCYHNWFAPSEVRPDTLGYLAIKAAVKGYRVRPTSALEQEEI